MGGREEGLWPHQSSIEEDNIEEERRLAYVGITRAQKELTFTLCKERRQYGELVRPEPSRFLLELPQDDLIWEQERKVVSAEERMQKGQSHLANLKAMMAAKRGKSSRTEQMCQHRIRHLLINALPAASGHSTATGYPDK